VESEFLVESLGSIFFSFINIEYLPLLMLSSVVSPNTDWMSFFILGTLNIKDLVVLPVDKLVILILENLPPS
jgi:hypothetical protein